jgi:hypothetical protein
MAVTAALAEQRHGDRPSVIDPAKHVLLRAAGLAEEDLVELALTGHHADWADFHPRLAHRHKQERDAPVFGRVRVGAG